MKRIIASIRQPRIATAIALLWAAGSAQAQYIQTNLVSNQPGVAAFSDAALVNPGAFASAPTGPMLFPSAGLGLFYDGTGFSPASPITVPNFSDQSVGVPTSVAYNSGSQFSFTNGPTTAPAQFVFATRDGTLAAFCPEVGPAAPNSVHAFTVFDGSAANSNFTGLSFGTTSGGEGRLFATDFANSAVSTFGESFEVINTPGAFTDLTLPSNFSPFNAQVIGNEVFVTYARLDASGDAPNTGLGEGLINVFDTQGAFQRRLTTAGSLDAPYGLAIAPSDFGPLSNTLLVGNVGDGRINAFDPNTGEYLGSLLGSDSLPLGIPGLRGLGFGNGSATQGLNTLFFSAGPDSGANGLVGSITIPAPSVAALVVLCSLAVARRRK